MSSRGSSGTSGGAWRESKAQVEDWPGRARAAQGPRDLCPPPRPPNENRQSGSARAREAPAAAAAGPGRGPVSSWPLGARPPASPDSLQPSRACRPRGAARPRPQLGRRRGRFQSAGRLRGRARGVGREATAGLARGRRKFLLRPAAPAFRPGLGCGGIRALRYSAAILDAESDAGLGYFLGARGEGGQEGALPLGKA